LYYELQKSVIPSPVPSPLLDQACCNPSQYHLQKQITQPHVCPVFESVDGPLSLGRLPLGSIETGPNVAEGSEEFISILSPAGGKRSGDGKAVAECLLLLLKGENLRDKDFDFEMGMRATRAASHEVGNAILGVKVRRVSEHVRFPFLDYRLTLVYNVA
jgi:hypothetical protein